MFHGQGRFFQKEPLAAGGKKSNFIAGELVFQFHGAEKVEKLDEEGIPKPAAAILISTS
jgi:hypothetical protein